MNVNKELEANLENTYNAIVENFNKVEASVKLASTVAVPTTAASEIVSEGTKVSEASEIVSEGTKVSDEHIAKAEEIRSQMIIAAVEDKKIRAAMETALEEVNMAGIIARDRRILNEVRKEDRARDQARIEKEKSMDDILNEKFNKYVVPAIIESSVNASGVSRDMRAEVRDNIKDNISAKTISIENGELKVMKGITLPANAGDMRALKGEVKKAWETAQKVANAEKKIHIQEQTKEAKINVIQNNLALDLTKDQREDAAKEMEKYTKDENVLEGIRNGNLLALNKVNDKTLDRLYKIMLRLGTENKDKADLTRARKVGELPKAG